MTDISPSAPASGSARPLPAEIIISADSHVAEPPELWEERLSKGLRESAPRFPRAKPLETNQHLRAGGWDPHERLKDLALAGISAEVLYPTLGAKAWAMSDPLLEEACVRVYNDWLIEFCRLAPDRFWGLAMVSLWNVDNAVRELERCQREGLRGATIWLVPPADLPFCSEHYEPFWAAAERLRMPVGLHITTGMVTLKGPVANLSYGVYGHKSDGMNALGDMVGSGVFERHPELDVVIAEAGVGWLPFFAQEFDYYGQRQWTLPLAPSQYVFRQAYATFISDRVGGQLASPYGIGNFMWSNDYPHPTSTWPDTAGAIAHDLGHLSPGERASVLCGNAARLYNEGRLPPPPQPPGEHQGLESWNIRGELAGVPLGPRPLSPRQA